MEFNTDLLARMVRDKRGTKGLREAAAEVGEVSAPTLSRIENGKVPDMDTFMRICQWLGVSADTFAPTPIAVDHRSKIIALLRGDRELDPKTISALETMINIAYNKTLD